MNTKNDPDTALASLGLKIPEVLLPRRGLDLQKWAVIACDQFTQDPGYWKKVKAVAAGAPSTLNFIYPELYLINDDQNSRNAKIKEIHHAMRSGMENGIFDNPRKCGIYLERSTPNHAKRRGLVIAIDLEKYEWDPGKKPLIRATEGTVASRLPARMEIRRNAPLETTHVLLLIDDEEDKIIPALGSLAQKKPALYHTPLMMNSGEVTGWAIDTKEAWVSLADGLQALAGKAAVRYGVKDKTPFLYAVGDGNHSLAAAKAVWNEYRTAHAGENGLEEHPLRFALAELENIYDPGISFEPIHRIVFGISAQELLEKIAGHKGFTAKVEKIPADNRAEIIRIIANTTEIVTASLEPVLENLIKDRAGISVDYIHGEEELIRIACDRSRLSAGLLLPPVQKGGFFKTVAVNGPLPKKSFSMGESPEKRFYFECRKLGQ
ncbi:MAG: DUF1015 domain-containing protein [Treponema sp.]|nr:DUF1015 domain-containing protein [Treponema sp.]